MLATISVTPNDFPEPGEPKTEIDNGLTIFLVKIYSATRSLLFE